MATAVFLVLVLHFIFPRVVVLSHTDISVLY